MRKNNLLTTIMAAAVAVVMIYTFSGCSDGQSTAATSTAATPAAVQETQKKGSSKAAQTPAPTLAVSGNTVSGTSSVATTSSGNEKNSPFTLYVTSKDGVNIRQKPSTSSGSIGMGDYGDSYTCVGSIMGEDGSSWYQVSYQGKNGYVSTAYASKNAPSGSSSGISSASSDPGTVGTAAGTGNDKQGSNAGSDSSDDQDGEAYLNLRTIYLKSEDGDIVAIKEQTNGDYAFRDDNGVGYTAIDEDYQWQDQYGNTYYTLEDSTHRFGYQLEQHTITAADGTTVTITEKADGPYRYRDENGVGYIDEGDGVWLDQYDNVYSE